MQIETKRLVLREMTPEDFDALYRVLADPDIMRHYPYTFENTPFREIYSYMKYTNEPSVKTAVSYGCRQVDEFEDEANEITKVFMISKDEWRLIK